MLDLINLSLALLAFLLSFLILKFIQVVLKVLFAVLFFDFLIATVWLEVL